LREHPELLERAAELSALGSALESVCDGAGRVVLVDGPAGIGKTALLDECARSANDMGLLVLRAQGDPVGMQSSFALVRELLQPRLQVAGDSMFEGAAAFARPVFELAGDGRASERDAGVALHGLYWLVAGLAERAPLVLLIDDSHWIDQASARFVSYLGVRLDSLRVMMVLAARSGEGRAPAELGAGMLLRPAPLSEDAASELVRSVLGARADVEFCRSCHHATGGNPFYLRALTAAIAADGARPTAALAVRVRELGVESVVRSVLVRLARLGSDSERLAQALSILAPRSQLRLVAEVAGLDRAAAAAAADALRGADLLEPERALAFTHPIVREAVRSDLPGSRQADLHGRAARLLAAEGASSDSVAAHLLAAEPFGERWVVDSLRKAAREAMSRGAHVAAVTYLRRALDEPPAPDQRLDVLVETGIAETGLPTTEFATLREALAMATEPGRRAEIALRLASALASVMRVVASSEVLEEIAAAADTLAPDLADRIHALVVACGVQDLSAPARMKPLVDRQLVRASRAESIHPALLVALAGTQIAAGEPAAGAAEPLLRAFADKRLLETPALYGAGCIVLTYIDQLEVAGRAADAALAVAQGIGSPLAFMSASNWRAMVDYRAGDLVAGEDHARGAREIAIESGAPLFALTTLVRILRDRGDVRGAAQLLEGAHPPEPGASTWQNAVLLAEIGQVKLALGELEEGLRLLVEADRRMRASGWSLSVMTNWAPAAAHALARLGRWDEAHALASRELAEARTFGAPRRLGIALSLCGGLDRGEPGLVWLREAVSLLESSPAKLECARALLNLGIGLRERGRREQAREPLWRAVELGGVCGADELVEQAHVELIASGARPRRTALSGPAALTPAELRAAKMAADGLTNRQIAQGLFVSTKTIESQLSQAYAKLGIRGRADVAEALAVRTPGDASRT
jgi:DNA-binding CsgD family transcriptional regulator